MAWTSWGFDGTINEAQWAQMAGLLGNGYVAAGNGDCLVTAVGGARSVSVAAGSLYGDGVVSTNSGAETVSMTTPVNGQWYVIALRRTWATNTAALVAIAGATTTTTTPTAPPTSFPTLNTNTGVLTDQPIAWAWCNSANTTVVVYDIRLKAVKSLPPVVANANERDAKFMTPTQGLQVWRDDLGATQTYYGLVSVGNPGGRDVAGWYMTGRNTGFVPIKPTSVNYGVGSATNNSLGVIDFTGVDYISLNNVFTSEYSNYKIVITNAGFSAGTVANLRLRSAGVNASSSYDQAAQWTTAGAGSGINAGNNQTSVSFLWTYGNIGERIQSAQMEVFSPAQSFRTKFNYRSQGFDTGGTFFGVYGNAQHNSTAQFDGFTFMNGSGTMTGTIQVFGEVSK